MSLASSTALGPSSFSSLLLGPNAVALAKDHWYPPTMGHPKRRRYLWPKSGRPVKVFESQVLWGQVFDRRSRWPQNLRPKSMNVIILGHLSFLIYLDAPRFVRSFSLSQRPTGEPKVWPRQAFAVQRACPAITFAHLFIS